MYPGKQRRQILIYNRRCTPTQLRNTHLHVRVYVCHGMAASLSFTEGAGQSNVPFSYEPQAFFGSPFRRDEREAFLSKARCMRLQLCQGSLFSSAMLAWTRLSVHESPPWRRSIFASRRLSNSFMFSQAQERILYAPSESERVSDVASESPSSSLETSGWPKRSPEGRRTPQCALHSFRKFSRDSSSRRREVGRTELSW